MDARARMPAVRRQTLLGGTGVMDDQLNVPLEDRELLDEVEMTTNLIIAATESADNLSQAEIDRLLGLPERSTPCPVQQVRGTSAQA